MAAGRGIAKLIEGIGIPGTPNGGIVTVQGDPSGTALIPRDNGDGMAAGAVNASGLYIWNGATWDKARGDTTQGVQVGLKRTTLVVTGLSAANIINTVNLPAAGVGLFHYITHIRISRAATAALAGTLTLNYVTTNLGLGALSNTWLVGNAMAAGGTQLDVDDEFVHPWKSAVSNTQSVVQVPACGLAVLSSILVSYYTGP